MRNLARHTSKGNPVIWVTPAGPMGQYAIIAEIVNKLGNTLFPKPESIFPFAMDEWSDQKANMLTQPEFPSYMTRFAEDMQEQSYGRMKDYARIPEENLRYAAGERLREYVPAIENLLELEAE